MIEALKTIAIMAVAVIAKLAFLRIPPVFIDTMSVRRNMLVMKIKLRVRIIAKSIRNNWTGMPMCIVKLS